MGEVRNQYENDAVRPIKVSARIVFPLPYAVNPNFRGMISRLLFDEFDLTDGGDGAFFQGPVWDDRNC